MIAASRMQRIVAGALLAAAMLPSYAQFGGGMGRGGGPGRGSDGGEAPAERRSVSASGGHLLVEHARQLDELRLELQLRPDQDALWSAYQEKAGALMGDQLRNRRDPPAAGEGALKQIGRTLDTVRNRLTALEDVVDAAGRLYAGLDGHQKETADRLLPATVPTLYGGLDAGRSGGPGGSRGPGRPGGGGPPEDERRESGGQR